MERPIRLTPSLREKVWGRTRLTPWFADSAQPVGEAWFLSDRDLPLLVKLVFTSEPLSVQVHPDDGEDGPRGKTEMWHILAAEPGAHIALGFRRPISREQLRDAARTGQIEKLVNWIAGGRRRDLLRAGAYGALDRRGHRIVRNPAELRRDLPAVGLRAVRAPSTWSRRRASRILRCIRAVRGPRPSAKAARGWFRAGIL